MPEEKSTFILNPIGFIRKKSSEVFIELIKKYLPGLKQIDHFSHIRLFWWCGENDTGEKQKTTDAESGQSGHGRAGVFACRAFTRPNPLALSTIRIKNVDFKKGLIYLYGIDAFPGAPVIDIKAYIPVVDRVKKTRVPEYLSKYPEWFDDKEHGFSGEQDDTKKQPKSLEIYPVGSFEKNKQKTFISIKPEYREALKGLEGFSHINLIWYFDRFDRVQLRRVLVCNPPYEAPKTGVFASRAPVRPNPIAHSVVAVRSVDIKNSVISISDTDAFAGTPVMDIKPYIPHEDRVKAAKVPDWLSHWPRWYMEESADETDPAILKPADVHLLHSYSYQQESKEHLNRNGKKEYRKEKQIDKNRIRITGAREHNLKNITVEIPRDKLTVITGVSGSGKSSLAFDTLYAEGQRRYMQSLSPTARSATGQMEKPDFDHIENLLPAIAINQGTISRNPRSTVGTVSDVYSYLRLLFARIGTRHCVSCGRAVVPQSAKELSKKLMNLVPGTVVNVCPGKVPDLITCTWIVDIQDDTGKIEEIVSSSYKKGRGFITLIINNEEEIKVSNRDACPYCDGVYFKMTPSIFSYNSPEGMCPECNGLGIILEVDPDRIITDPDKSLLDGASPWYGDLRKHMKNPNANWMRGEILALAGHMNVDLELPWKKLPEDFRQRALYGTGEKKFTFTYESPKRGRSGTIERPVAGAVNNLKRLFTNSRAENSRDVYMQFLKEIPCTKCHGERLSAQGRLVTVAGKRYPEIASMTLREACTWVSGLPCFITKEQKVIARDIIDELEKRLKSMIQVELHYLNLDRPVTTLSGGEAQRIRLAGQLGCGLSGLLYILDEPSIGLHPRDHNKLISTMKELRDAGNTVVVVEHDADTMRAADHIIDLGPGAGVNGGRITASGSPDEVMENPDSLTGLYLKKKITYSGKKDKRRIKNHISISGVSLHNLKGFDVSFPLGVVTCVTGVSGSGKSSLVRDTLVPAIRRRLHGSEDPCGPYKKISGLKAIDKIISVNQSPIGRSPRSNPATYIGVFDEIRSVFAGTDDAKKRKFKANRFSFNDKNGRCSACEGLGKKKIDMSFLPDVWVTCSECGGRRYNKDTLKVKYRDKTIADVLDMDIQEAFAFFNENQKLMPYLKTLIDVGLDYLKLGQSSVTLSGGEAQRIKLAKELTRPDTGCTVYVLDEPTTGLHFADIKKLLKVLHSLADLGNTIIIIEHNLDVIKTADWVIDLGPEGGNEGGTIVARGTPEQVSKIKESYTGQFLKKILK
jgi:excinuclease ABC subunit A